MLNIKEIEKKVDELKKSLKRNFEQTIELIVNLRHFNIKDSKNRFAEYIQLPYLKYKNKIVIFSDEIKNFDKENIKVMNSKDIQALTRREAKKLARDNDVFLAESKLMPLVGKHLGFTLGPRGKIPKVLVGNVEKIIEEAENYTRIRIKDNPQIQCKVGTESMDSKEIAENIITVLNFVLNKLEKRIENIKSIMIKKTMSKPIILFKHGK